MYYISIGKFQEMNGADKLKSAESAIHFIQKEHERVLHGLHMEIERLQQKCSGILQIKRQNR